MKMRVVALFSFIFIACVGASAQDYSSIQSPAVPKSLILYDPLFWKDQLKLSTIQQKLIDKINIEFYENIKAAYSIYNGKQASYQIEITDLLMSRSEQIWETFRHRQKRRWEKLDIVNVHPENSERTQSAF